MLTQENFKPVTLADRAFFDNHYVHYPRHIVTILSQIWCAGIITHITSMLMNEKTSSLQALLMNNAFRPPIGPRDPYLLKSLIRLASDISDSEPVVLIDPETARWMRKVCPGINLVPDRNHFEYVYRSEDLATFPEKII